MPDDTLTADTALTIEFREPVTHKGVRYERVTLIEPTAGQVLRATEPGREYDDARWVGIVAGLAPDIADAVIGELPVSQLTEATDFLSRFQHDKDAAPEEDLPDELEIPLDEEVRYAGGVIDRLVLREPKASEIIRAGRQNGMARVVTLVSLVSGVPRQGIERVPVTKIWRAFEYLQGFQRAGRRTGGT